MTWWLWLIVGLAAWCVLSVVAGILIGRAFSLGGPR